MASDTATSDTKIKDFERDNQRAAMNAANEWLGDFTQHGVLMIEKIVAVPRMDKWVVSVHYSEKA